MITPGDEIVDATVLSCDVCIVGSGAGGAVLAAGLAERGLDVVILEEGGSYTSEDFDLDEGEAFARLYQERGTRATADQAITILQGRSVGGSTTVNWTTCFRTPERILAHWREVHGLALDASTLRPHWEAVEQRLSIGTWPEERINANNRVLRDGCRALGWEYASLKRNVSGCANSGYCGFGCPVDAKQAMHLTYLPDGMAHGLRIYADTRADRLEVAADRVVAVHATVMERDRDRPTAKRLTVRPKLVVSSAGAINGPALLLRSGLDFDGVVGKRTFLHPVIAVTGRYERPIHPWYGAPQSIGSHEFIDRGPTKMGFFMEVPPFHPMLAATAFNHFGRPMSELLAGLSHTSAVIALMVDGLLPGDDGGTVSLRSDGRVRVDYPFRPALIESFRAAYKAMSRVHWAAGATTTVPLHSATPLHSSQEDVGWFDGCDLAPLRHSVFTAHQMGGCAMGPDPKSSVVNPELRHHHVDNLYVVDGSVFPTALGVNPSLSIYGLAHWARDAIAAAVR